MWRRESDDEDNGDDDDGGATLQPVGAINSVENTDYQRAGHTYLQTFDPTPNRYHPDRLR
jgi:hypothetical protein